MTFVTMHAAPSDRKSSWRRRRHERFQNGSDPAAAIGFHSRRPCLNDLAELPDLVISAAHADTAGSGARVVAFRGVAVPWGVQLGEAEQCLFDKDPKLPALPGGPGRHLDSRRPQIVRTAQRLWHMVEDRGQRQRRLNRDLQLPRFWAGFDSVAEEELRGDGPELFTAARQLQLSQPALFHGMRREHRRLVLYPLDWVSHHWATIKQVFADLSTCPERQLVRLEPNSANLQGYRGASRFDFASSRFTRQRRAA